MGPGCKGSVVSGSAVSAALLLCGLASAQGEAWQANYRVGQQVRFAVSEKPEDLQTCTVTENPPGGFMRVRCEQFKHWGPGNYIVYSQLNLESGMARPAAPAAVGTPTPTPSATPGAGASAPAAAANNASAASAATDLCRPGAKVEGEWGIGWYEVTVVSGRDGQGQCIVSFDGYDPALWSRREVYNLRTRGSGGEVTRPVQPVAAQAPVQAAAGQLRSGEYACYGSGSQVLAGLAFKVVGPGRYTDLEGGNAGSYRVDGSTVTFTGGHLGGQTGRELNNGTFRIGAMAQCEPW